MFRIIALTVLLSMSTASPARTVDACVTLDDPEQIALLLRELNSLKMSHRVDQRTVCVDEASGSRFLAVVSRLFTDPSKTRYLRTPRTPSGVAAQSFNFRDATKQAALEGTLRRKGIWFEKDASGTMWYEITNEAVVREMVFAIAEGDSPSQRSNPTVETDARKSGARGSP
jgi:hypothetical protein